VKNVFKLLYGLPISPAKWWTLKNDHYFGKVLLAAPSSISSPRALDKIRNVQYSEDVFTSVKGVSMLRDVFVSTSLQRALSLLAQHPDQSYFVKEISRLAGISYGGASEALAHLHALELVTREQRGRLVLYAANTRHPLIRYYKVLLTLADLTPLLDELKPLASGVILFGSCAEGANTAESDIDLYIITDNPDAIHDLIWRSPLAEKLRPVISTAIESTETKQQDPVFYEQVMSGIVLWRRSAPDGG